MAFVGIVDISALYLSCTTFIMFTHNPCMRKKGEWGSSSYSQTLSTLIGFTPMCGEVMTSPTRAKEIHRSNNDHPSSSHKGYGRVRRGSKNHRFIHGPSQPLPQQDLLMCTWRKWQIQPKLMKLMGFTETIITLRIMREYNKSQRARWREATGPRFKI